ncbi:hypothetical protein M427DRAFT_63018 [Gonapodya prolifera JEL478]|uniref:Crossover junction endonuclease MUS81 n=1 Tax=Gonapodya prolifera (strain JEL478) TaxID=1344416 RepID=A0A139A019_GONPJ|nr:hypothetical protein M427DRAFT_63018 [Gonapodya prolifera JEL478]|eukprot:KXS10082.1 hypothetical protein M427DRAFT_63018 [Gonapodya prolifera JEL478]
MPPRNSLTACPAACPNPVMWQCLRTLLTHEETNARSEHSVANYKKALRNLALYPYVLKDHSEAQKNVNGIGPTIASALQRELARWQAQNGPIVSPPDAQPRPRSDAQAAAIERAAAGAAAPARKKGRPKKDALPLPQNPPNVAPYPYPGGSVTGQMGQMGQAGQAGQVGQAGQAGQAGQMGQAGQQRKRSNEMRLLDEDSGDEQPVPPPRKRARAPKQPKAPKPPKPYSPRLRSGNWAILMALLHDCESPGGPGFMYKADLIRAAQPLCDASLYKPPPGSLYTAYSNNKRLVKANWIEKEGNPVRFTLTALGEEKARRFRAAAPPGSLNPGGIPVVWDGDEPLTDDESDWDSDSDHRPAAPPRRRAPANATAPAPASARAPPPPASHIRDLTAAAAMARGGAMPKAKVNPFELLDELRERSMKVLGWADREGRVDVGDVTLPKPSATSPTTTRSTSSGTSSTSSFTFNATAARTSSSVSSASASVRATAFTFDVAAARASSSVSSTSARAPSFPSFDMPDVRPEPVPSPALPTRSLSSTPVGSPPRTYPPPLRFTASDVGVVDLDASPPPARRVSSAGASVGGGAVINLDSDEEDDVGMGMDAVMAYDPDSDVHMQRSSGSQGWDSRPPPAAVAAAPAFPPPHAIPAGDPDTDVVVDPADGPVGLTVESFAFSYVKDGGARVRRKDDADVDVLGNQVLFKICYHRSHASHPTALTVQRRSIVPDAEGLLYGYFADGHAPEVAGGIELAALPIGPAPGVASSAPARRPVPLVSCAPTGLTRQSSTTLTTPPSASAGLSSQSMSSTTTVRASSSGGVGSGRTTIPSADRVLQPAPYRPAVQTPRTWTGPAHVILAGTYDVYCVVDLREIRSKGHGAADRQYLQDGLARVGVKVETKVLHVGDVMWVAKKKGMMTGDDTDDVVLDYIVERKTVDDLIASIKDGRFKEQKFRLSNCGLSHVTYLLEGQISYANRLVATDEGKWMRSTFTAMVETIVSHGFFIKNTYSIEETVKHLAMMSRMIEEKYRGKDLYVMPSKAIDKMHFHTMREQREAQDGRRYLVPFKSFNGLNAKATDNVVNQWLKTLLTCKGVSAEKAKVIAKAYPTPSSLYAALDQCPDLTAKQRLFVNVAEPDAPDRRKIKTKLAERLAILFTAREYKD